MAAATADWRARVYQELRRHRPQSVAVHADDDVKTFKPSGGERGRWPRLLEALPSEWTRIELLDKDGDILWALDAQVQKSEGALPGLAKGGAVDQVTALMKLMLQAQDVALARHAASVAQLSQGYESLASMLSQRLQSLEVMVSTSIQSVYDMTVALGEAQVAALAAQSQGGPRTQAQQMFETLIMRKLGVVPKRPGGPKPNGASRPTQHPTPPPE